MSVLRRVRAGVVGVGDFGARHARVAARLPILELCAVCDINFERSQAIATELGTRPYERLDDMLAGEDLEALVIATPEDQHLEPLRQALEKGIHVLVEKPVASTAEEVAWAEREAERRGVIALPGHLSRYLPEVSRLREVVRGRRILAIHALRTVPRERLAIHGRTHPVMMAMIHDLDLIRAIQKSELTVVLADERWEDRARPHPQLVWATLTFHDGCVATVENHWSLPHNLVYVDARLRVITDQFIAEVMLPAGGLRIATHEGESVPDTQVDAWVDDRPVGALATQLHHFADCILSATKSHVVSMQDAVWCMRTAELIIRRAGGQVDGS